MINEEEEESDEDSSDSISVLSQTEYQFTGYDVHNNENVSEDYKNKRNVNVEIISLILSCCWKGQRSLMSEAVLLTERDSRLKKIVRKLSIDLSNNDSV